MASWWQRLVVVTGVWLLALATAAPATAQLSVPQPEARVGEVRCGAPLRQTFTLTNAGQVPLDIGAVRPGCGCLTSGLESQQLPPGGSTTLRLEVNTLSQAAGPQRWTATVHWRTGEQTGETPLHILGTVVAEIGVEPALLRLVTTRAASHEVCVTDPRARPLTVTRALVSSPHVQTRLAPATTNPVGGKVTRVLVEVAADLPPGDYQETLQIFTDDPAYPQLRVPLTLIKRPADGVTATPEQVTLAVRAGQPAPSQLVRLRGGDAAVVVEKVESDTPAVSARWAAGPGNHATLRVQADPAHVGAAVRGTLKVHFRQPAGLVLSIPVLCQTD